MSIKRRTRYRTIAVLIFWLTVLTVRVIIIWPIDNVWIWSITIVLGFCATTVFGWYLRRLYEEWLGVDKMISERTNRLNELLGEK